MDVILQFHKWPVTSLSSVLQAQSALILSLKGKSALWQQLLHISEGANNIWTSSLEFEWIRSKNLVTLARRALGESRSSVRRIPHIHLLLRTVTVGSRPTCPTPPRQTCSYQSPVVTSNSPPTFTGNIGHMQHQYQHFVKTPSSKRLQVKVGVWFWKSNNAWRKPNIYKYGLNLAMIFSYISHLKTVFLFMYYNLLLWKAPMGLNRR